MSLSYHIMPVTPFQQNCTLLWDEQTMRGVAVDPGGEVEAICAAGETRGITFEAILCTHGHLDHVGGVAAMAEKLSLPIIGPHRDDLFWIEQLPQQASAFGFPPCELFCPDQWLTHGDEIEVAGIKFDVLHCPGHTPGHIVFFQPKARLALVGDVLFQGSIGRTDFPRGNYDELIHSIRTYLWPLGDDVRFIPGHGMMSSFGAERQSNPFVGDFNFAS